MKLFGLIGTPLSHSFSQRWFTDKFAREGLSDHRYDPYELEHIDELAGLLRSKPELRGLNVTIPHKKSVLPLLDAVDPVALAVGAVNTIKIVDGRTTGYNTDVIGFREALRPALGTARPRALVLGSGGASRSVVYVLRELGIKFRVVSRSRENGDITWDLLDPALVSVCGLIINTTPLGMYPDVEGMPPVPLGAIGQRHTVMDLVYNPERTRLLIEAEARGARVMNGLTMLHAQAQASWDIWSDDDRPPTDYKRASP
jgi:shikimate dehydrogenase